MDLRFHITGVDALIREFDRKIDGMEEALDEGCQDAADYLVEKIEDKFGVYQPGWEHLKDDTIRKKDRKGNSMNASKPLVDYGDMMFSFETQTSNRSRKHTIAITSNDPKLVHHVYGAPSAHVPKRDPVRPTVAEEREECHNIVRRKVEELMDE